MADDHKRRALPWVMLAVLIPAAMAAAAAGAPDPRPCTQMRGECRLKTQRQRLGEDFFTHLNVSCYCKHGEDVFEDLQSLLSVKCSWLPSEPDMKVNSSAIHVVGCSVKSQTFPTGILQLARRTESLEIVVKDSPKLRLAPLSTTEGTVPKITANFINSNLSGLPEGWVTDGKDVELMTKDCEVPILESRALVGYAEDAQVHATFINTDIFTIRMGAFALPKNSVVRMAEGKVLNWERSGYTGGSELHLVRVRLGKVPSKAFDISSLKVFTMSGCNVAAMYDEALTYHGTMNRAEEGAAKAVLASNNFIEANGAALARLCHFQALDFHNNTFVNITDPPLRLYRPGCQPERDWDKAVSNTGLSCTRCEDFSEPDAQSCAIYKSAHCISCAENVDECNVDVLPFLVLNKCPSSHPALVESLQNACDVRAAATAAQARSLDSAAASAAPAALVLVAGLALSVLRGRDAHCG